MPKNIIMFLVGLLLSTGLVYNANNIHHIYTNTSEIINSDASIFEKSIDYETNNLELDIKIPIVRGLKNKKIEQNLNRKIRKDILHFKKEIEDKANKDIYSNIHYETVTSYEVPFQSDNIISITILFYEYTGGNHGVSKKAAYNFDLNTGEEITLKSIFIDGIGYKEIINNEIEKQISQCKDTSFFTGEDGFTGIHYDQAFYFKDDSIIIYFELYDIAPYSSGIPEFKIPLRLLKDIILPEYLAV
ncbi:MAG: DUF3298 DUF4163 domains-containing protein [Xylanivirga thermophila]|jgi:hypothetical protein|uniref:DUF3298 and DUF4163 domain-containing protein n=1 Tax=Xylanivirga thermophila TaxID=2496273 RepID=UPI0039F5AF9C